MAMKRDGLLSNFTAIPPEKRGLPAVDGWSSRARPLQFKAVSGADAMADFSAGRADLVLGGTFADLPRLKRTALGKTKAQMDPVIGLFGLVVARNDGLLGVAQNREAIAMAIDREALAAQMAVPGWQPTTSIVTPGTEADTGLVGERWTNMDLAARRTQAASRIASWRKTTGKPAQLSLALPAGPGADQLAMRLTSDLAAIGITLQRVDEDAPADLRLLDAVARFAHPAWFLNQLSCLARRGPCSRPADELAARAALADATDAGPLYAQAERTLAQSNVFIPLGAPIRWSLVGAEVGGFAVNRWGSHPLSGMAIRAK